MPPVTVLGRTGFLISSLLILSMVPFQAVADGGWDWDRSRQDGTEVDESASSDGASISSQVVFQNSAGDSEPSGVVTSQDVDWSPPACWYEPRTASETREYVTTMLQTYNQMPDHDIDDARTRLVNHYQRGDPYDNYNLDIEDEGYFWFGVANPERRDDPDAFSCHGLAEWVETGETPDDPLAISPETMAQAAYEWLPLPETDISLSPDANNPQTVNLPTWIWQDTDSIGEVSATASLQRLGLEVTTTATPSALHLDPGTDDATLHPGSGECALNSNGTIGEPYRTGRAGETPPCGITYLRATPDGTTYPLTATITWSVTWTGTDNPTPQPLPSAVLETTQDITVQEVQSIVR